MRFIPDIQNLKMCLSCREPVGDGQRKASPLPIILAAFAIYWIAWGYLHYFQFLTPYISEADPHFHMKASWLMRTQGILHDFRWASASVWRDGWFNKDFGFHLLLMPFTFGDLVHNTKLAAVTLGAAVFASFYLVIRLSRIKYAFGWALFLLLCSGGYFGYRVNVARPQLISIIFSLWGMFFVLRRSPLGVAVVTFLYSLSYAAPHVMIGYGALMWAASLFSGHHHGAQEPCKAAASEGCEGPQHEVERSPRWPLWALPLVALGALLLGWLVHPSFPHTFSGWWAQNVGVLGTTWGTGASDLYRAMAVELHPSDTRSMVVEHLPLVLLATWAALVAWPRVSRRDDPRLVTLVVVALGYLFLTMLSRRFIELLLPFATWAVAAVLSAAVAQRVAQPQAGVTRPRSGWVKGVGGLAVVVLLAFGLYRTTTQNYLNFSSFSFRGKPLAAQWLHHNTPADSVVFTCDWDDAPELFFYNHRNRYLIFLDPAFMFRWRPTVWRTWRTVAGGDDLDPVRTIRDAFGATGGYCTRRYPLLQEQLRRDDRVKLQELPDGAFVFSLVEVSGAQ